MTKSKLAARKKKEEKKYEDVCEQAVRQIAKHATKVCTKLENVLKRSKYMSVGDWKMKAFKDTKKLLGFASRHV